MQALFRVCRTLDLGKVLMYTGSDPRFMLWDPQKVGLCAPAAARAYAERIRFAVLGLIRVNDRIPCLLILDVVNLSDELYQQSMNSGSGVPDP